MVPTDRIRLANTAPERLDGRFVLYWMTAARRTRRNVALEHAIGQAKRLGKPLLVFEPLRTGWRWATDRYVRFTLEGMRDNAAAFAETPVRYVPWIETTPDAGKGLLAAVAAEACLVVTDEFPCVFAPRMLAAAASQSPVRMEVVDGCGLLPLSQGNPVGKIYERAVDFRRMLQKNLAPHLGVFPVANPLIAAADLPRVRELPRALRPSDVAGLLAAGGLTSVPCDHRVGAGALTGGAVAAAKELQRFITAKLARYADDRSDIEADAASGLSPWLHHGHLSVHDVAAAVWKSCDWSPQRLAEKATGSKEGWWGAPPAVESFLDELVTWRELGYHFCHRRPDYDQWDSLPAWARRTLDDHAADPRPHLYTFDQLDAGDTHDPLWNAAQRQLVREGRMPNYLRMLWGKKVLEWSASPQQAFATLIDLNNRYALDGCDPNSYTGIAWCFGRFDRPWAPIRPIFGMIRYMSSASTAKKMRVQGYIARYAGQPGQTSLLHGEGG